MVTEFAARFGVTRDRVLACEVEVEDGEYTSTLLEPIPFDVGKRDLIDQWIRRRPALAFGDSNTDYAMLECATELAVVIDRHNPDTQAYAREKGWLLQPKFIRA